MKLMALAMPSTQITLSRYDQFGSRMNVPDERDAERRAWLMPENTSTLAASDDAGHLGRRRHLAQVVDGADRRAMSTAAITRPSGSVLPSKIGSKASHAPGDEHADEEADQHGDAAERRRRPLVHPALVGLDDRADPDRDAPHERRARRT